MSRLDSERLFLRPPEERDAKVLALLANDYDIVKNTSRMPWPYAESDARAYIARSAEERALGTEFTFVIAEKGVDAPIGSIGLRLNNGTFEFGYWLGKDFWGQGYATEAAHRLLAFAFDALRADSVWAGYFFDNPASGRVLQKLGCRAAGSVRRYSVARGQSVLCHGTTLTRADFRRKKAA